MNEETLKTANQATFDEKKFKNAIKSLKEELLELKKDADHKARCYAKIQKDNDSLRTEKTQLELLARGAKADEFKKMQVTVDEKDRQIRLLKEMIRGVKGELKVRDVDLSRLKGR